MFANKRNVLELVALLKAHNIKHVVVSPGSRNAPLIHNFSVDSFFVLHSVVDERSAGFIALGIAHKEQHPVAVCCTSGTALLNIAPAVAEAFYSQVPLIVISADRAPEWIGQMDGQTIVQPNALSSVTRMSVNVPEVKDEQDLWHANRIINEALNSCYRSQSHAPVHINIPISEPLMVLTQPKLPAVRVIHQWTNNGTYTLPKPLREEWQQSPKRIIVVGQLPPTLVEIEEKLSALKEKTNTVILCEHTANIRGTHLISNFDTVIATTSTQQRETLVPHLVITIGGHITSKRLKKLFRQHQPTSHWHVTPLGSPLADLFQCLTHHVEAPLIPFLEELINIPTSSTVDNLSFAHLWQEKSNLIEEPCLSLLPFSDIVAMGTVIKRLPQNCILHLGNSSVIRNAQFFTLPHHIPTYSCRGVNGIEGSLPTAIGYASVDHRLSFLLIGDISFFYSLGALWQMNRVANLRIILFNNGGGAIFRSITGTSQSGALPMYIEAQHSDTAKTWIEAAKMDYISTHTVEELSKAMDSLTQNNPRPIVLEVFTSIEESQMAIQNYIHTQRK